MQPIQYSIKEKVWRRNGTHIDYYRNNYIRTKGKKKVVSKKCKGNYIYIYLYIIKINII